MSTGTNSVATHDAATNVLHQALEAFSFNHQGAAGSTSLNFGEEATSQQHAAISSTAVGAPDVSSGAGNGSSGTGTAATMGDAAGSGQNAFLTNDNASSSTQTIEKMLTFNHQGAAGSTSLSFGEDGLTHNDAQSSTTSAMVNDGLFGGSSASGSSSGSAGLPGGSDGSSGSGDSNAFTTSDNNINFDSQMLKSFDFSHEGAAGSTSFGFEIGNATQWDSQSSSTSAMFDDLFGQGLWDTGGSQAFIG